MKIPEFGGDSSTKVYLKSYVMIVGSCQFNGVVEVRLAPATKSGLFKLGKFGSNFVAYIVFPSWIQGTDNLGARYISNSVGGLKPYSFIVEK